MTKFTRSIVRCFAIACVAFAAAAITTPALRADTTTPPPPAPAPAKDIYNGSVTAVDTTKNTITIQPATGSTMTFTLGPNCKVQVKREDATLADIKVGYTARIRSTDGTTAIMIHAHPPKPPKGSSGTSGT